MSSTSQAHPQRRVRHEVRDGFVVMLFSAAASTLVAVGLILASHVLAGAGN